mmetsp:Transcript_63531/g.177808  ORF Transcript_63531/g.177808 Transcript_63531/m.177808 type:complete len:255 (-) Transcript_63531:823-1587(-)
MPGILSTSARHRSRSGGGEGQHERVHGLLLAGKVRGRREAQHRRLQDRAVLVLLRAPAALGAGQVRVLRPRQAVRGRLPRGVSLVGTAELRRRRVAQGDHGLQARSAGAHLPSRRQRDHRRRLGCSQGAGQGLREAQGARSAAVVQLVVAGPPRHGPGLRGDGPGDAGEGHADAGVPRDEPLPRDPHAAGRELRLGGVLGDSAVPCDELRPQVVPERSGEKESHRLGHGQICYGHLPGSAEDALSLPGLRRVPP